MDTVSPNTPTPTTSANNKYILAIETSCDETAISALFGMEIRSHKIHSQADLHAEFGGVFPNLAKREHTKNIIPLLSLVLSETCDTPIYTLHETPVDRSSDENIDIGPEPLFVDAIKVQTLKDILHREPEALHDLLMYLRTITPEQFSNIKHTFTAIAVTYGPGLEPALWVGISVAKALAVLLDLPLYPINHMEGHIASVLSSIPATGQNISPEYPKIEFPAIALLISGGHTELVRIDAWHTYAVIGKTVDDAIGEAYDKVARLIGLPYPGGPAISKLAHQYRQKKSHGVDNRICETDRDFVLPRPMLHSKDYNFSFSGLKTAVLYAVKKKLEVLHTESLTDTLKESLAAEFEDAATEVLVHKTKRAIEDYGAHTLIIGGGVIANNYIRSEMKKLSDQYAITLYIPELELTTDNASMIGLVASLQITSGHTGLKSGTLEFESLRADGNLSL